MGVFICCIRIHAYGKGVDNSPLDIINQDMNKFSDILIRGSDVHTESLSELIACDEFEHIAIPKDPLSDKECRSQDSYSGACYYVRQSACV